MGQIFEPYEPDQAHLFPASPKDWLPEGHLAFFVSDTVDELDIEPFVVKYAAREDGRGSLAYHPRMLLKVLIYSYAVGVFSSRRIATGLEDLVALRYLSAGNRPSHRTIARFRQENVEHFERVFVEVVRIARRAGLIQLGTVAIDGTKLQANASKHKAMSYGRMKEEEEKLRREIKRITQIAAGTDEAEDGEFGPDFRGDEVPAELQRRQERRAKIRAAMKQLEEEQAREDAANGRGEPSEKTGRTPELKRPNGTPPDKAQMNFTDPESRIMVTGKQSFEQCYNAQAAVDAKQRIIVATHVGANPSDSTVLVEMTNRVTRNLGRKPKRVLADSGYRSEANFVEMERREIDAYVALARGERAPGDVNPSRPATRRMARKLASKCGRARYKRRKDVVEPVFGWAKQALGFRGFLMRGLRKVQGEWNLLCAALNLRRMKVAMA
jgi:transposase/IS5 family transposase